MIIQHNISAMNANRQLGITQGNLSKSTEKLSSGYNINRAGDNAAGLAISEKMRGQIRGLNQASTNADDGISLVQTAEGALQETQNILQRMRELAVQASNDTNTDDDRTQIQKEIKQLTNEVDRIATTSEFNTKKLLDGSQTGIQPEEEGEATVEGTFTNGLCELKTIELSDSEDVAINDVIRITIQKGLTDTSTFGATQVSDASDATAQTGSIAFTVDSLNGFSNPAVGGTLGDVAFADSETITLNNVCWGGAKQQLSDSMVNGSTQAPASSVALSISGSFANLQAGDVITISLKAGHAEKALEEGKESLKLQVGANAGQEMDLSINSMKAKDLGIVRTSGSTTDAADAGTALDVTSQSKASMAIEAFDKALTLVSTERAKLGAVQNRLEHTIANLDTSEENLQAAESRIRDVDMADQMTSFSKDNILQQAGTSMLAQANQANQTVLSLLS